MSSLKTHNLNSLQSPNPSAVCTPGWWTGVASLRGREPRSVLSSIFAVTYGDNRSITPIWQMRKSGLKEDKWLAPNQPQQRSAQLSCLSSAYDMGVTLLDTDEPRPPPSRTLQTRCRADAASRVKGRNNSGYELNSQSTYHSPRWLHHTGVATPLDFLQGLPAWGVACTFSG